MSWISRKGRDRYYRLAKERNKPSRAYFKLMHLDRRYGIIRSGFRIVDLGSAPGGWVHYELERVGEAGIVVSVDLDEYQKPHTRNLVFLQADILRLDASDLLMQLGGKADVVASDAAPHLSGIREVDMARHYELAEAALRIAKLTLSDNGWFMVKLFMSEEFRRFAFKLKTTFGSVNFDKPQSSRKESGELYAVCRRLLQNA